MAKNSENLSDKQKEFCEQYIIDFNATQAAIRAGYSKKTANRIASENLSKLDIQDYIKELIQNRNERTQITQDEVVKDIIELKDRCLQKIPVMYFDKEEKEYIQETDANGEGVWKFDSQGAARALDMLAKHTGVYQKDNEQKAPTTSTVNLHFGNKRNATDNK